MPRASLPATTESTPNRFVLYEIARWLSSTSLHWFYRDIEVVGSHRLPRSGPALLAVNHPNALVDAMVVMHLLPQRVSITAKATLFEHPVLRIAFPQLGILPLRRAKDEGSAGGVSPERNEQTFGAILDELERSGTVLFFPEGISHDEPALAPLRTGLARMAIQARDVRGIPDVRVVPIGLVFERKGSPRSRVLVQVGEPLLLDEWTSPGPDSAAALTADVEGRLHRATLNFASGAESERVRGMARLLTEVFDEPRPLDAPDPPLTVQVAVLRRIQAAERAPLHGEIADRAERFLARLEALRAELVDLRIPANEITLSLRRQDATRFARRELWVLLTYGVVAGWGYLNHWIPIRLTLGIARRTSRTPEDPAMHVLVIGVFTVLLTYAVGTTLLWWLVGPVWAMAYLASLPASGGWYIRVSERLRRARQRVRVFFRFRRDRVLQQRLTREIEWLRSEALALEKLTARQAQPNAS